MSDYATVSAKIPVALRRKMTELGIAPSEVIKRALEKEVEEREYRALFQKVEKASRLMSKVGKEGWIRAVRESREGR